MKLIQVTKRFPLREILGEYTLLKQQGIDLYFTKDDNNHGVILYRSIDPTRDVIEKNHTVYMDSFPIDIEGNLEFCRADDEDISTFCDYFMTNCYGVDGIVADLLPEDLWVMGKGRRLVRYVAD